MTQGRGPRGLRPFLILRHAHRPRRGATDGASVRAPAPTRVPCSIARLASSSAATSAPPIRYRLDAGRLEAGDELAPRLLAGADRRWCRPASSCALAVDADVQAGVVDLQVLDAAPASARRASCSSGAARPSRWSWPGRRRPCVALRCSSQTSRGGGGIGGAARPPRLPRSRVDAPLLAVGRRSARRVARRGSGTRRRRSRCRRRR